MKDWVQLITAIIQGITAIILLRREKPKKKGTKKRRARR